MIVSVNIKRKEERLMKINKTLKDLFLQRRKIDS